MTISRREHLALPGWCVDLLRDGLPSAAVRAEGDLAVWMALGRTAMSAINCGHSRAEWEQQVLRPNSGLGLQVRVDARGRERTERSVSAALSSAWTRANQRVKASPRWDTTAAREVTTVRADLLRQIAELDSTLTGNQQTLIEYVANLAEHQGRTRVNVARRATAEATGLTEKAVRCGLDRLVNLGLLVLAERGRRRDPRGTAPARANVYALPDEDTLCAYLSRETRQVGPSAQTGRPQAPGTSRPLAQTGRPHDEEEHDVDRIVLTRDEIVAALGEVALAKVEAFMAQADGPIPLHLVDAAADGAA